MRRALVSLLVLLGVLALTEGRLTDNISRPFTEPFPPLWDEARHVATDASPARLAGGALAESASLPQCAFVTSADPGNRFPFTPVDQGVSFDIDSDGDLDQVSWPEPGADVGFVVIDRDADGRIGSGKELVGNYAAAGVRNGPDAFHVLAGREPRSGERRPALDARDELFGRLLLWTDANHDGVSQADELRSAADVLSHISLGFSKQHRIDAHGNESRYRGVVHLRTAAGTNEAVSAEDSRNRRRAMHHVCLVTRRYEAP